MRKTFFSSTMMWNASLREMLRMTAEHGFSGIEVWYQHFEIMGCSEQEYLDLSRDYGLETLVHAPSWDVNIASISEALRRASVEETKRSVDFAFRTGAGELTVHPGQASSPHLMELCRDRLFDSLNELYEYATSRGVAISLEIMEKTPLMLASTAQSMEESTGSLFDRFFYTVDLAHCDCEEEFFSLISTFPRISKIHISNRKGAKLHTPLFEGDYDFRRLLPELRALGYPLVVEGMDTEESFSLAQKTVSFLETMDEWSCLVAAEEPTKKDAVKACIG